MNHFGQVLTSILLISGCFCRESLAQESIFVPLEQGTDAGAVGDGAQMDDASRFVALQGDLYRIVLTFEEPARALERVLFRNEEARLANHERMMQAKAAGILPDENGNYGGEMPIIGSSLCRDLDESLARYIAKNSSEMTRVVQNLTKQASTMTEAQKGEFAARIRVAVAAIPDLRRAEEILYLCLYKYKSEAGTPTAWSVDKTMRKWFALQLPLMDAWLGNVD